MSHTTPNHATEIAELQHHATSSHLGALEAKAVLVAIEMLEAHEAGSLEISDLPHATSLVSLCLGTTFEPIYATS